MTATLMHVLATESREVRSLIKAQRAPCDYTQGRLCSYLRKSAGSSASLGRGTSHVETLAFVAPASRRLSRRHLAVACRGLRSRRESTLSVLSSAARSGLHGKARAARSR